jgi:iron complex transport system permease protein
MNRYLLITLLTLAALFSLLLALISGSAQADLASLWQSLAGTGDPMLREVVLQLRLPRALAAFGTGASLALAGAMMQILLRNPLADPYILGTSGGAATAALIAMLLGSTGLLIDAAAFGGALASTILVFSLAQTGSDRAPGRLLLTGVVVAAGWGAAISLILALAPERNLRGMLFWMMGDFSFTSRATPALLLAAITVLIGLIIAPALNLLATGDRQAALLGVAVRPMRVLLYFLSALLTAVAVTTAGTVGFVGLVTPHLIRLVGGSDHRTVLPCSALAGGSLLVIADTLARTIVAPQQLPVGAITALLGVPLFLVLLHRLGNDRQQGN